MTRKDIYVFKAKFGVGNFEIEVYKLPVKKETAKAYFVDDHYTYRKKGIKRRNRYYKRIDFRNHGCLS